MHVDHNRFLTGRKDNAVIRCYFGIIRPPGSRSYSDRKSVAVMERGFHVRNKGRLVTGFVQK